MLDNPLIILLLSTINAQLAAAGIADTPIVQADQPTQQGVFTSPAGYLHKLGDVRRGSPQRSDIWDPMAETEVHTESQVYETTFQISTLAIQTPGNLTQKTASDIANALAYILQSETTIETLNAQGVGMLKISDVRNPYFKDDRDRFEASPNLDFTVCHNQTIITTAPIATDVNFNLISLN